MEYEGLQGASLGERANRLTAAAFDEVHVATAKSTLLRELAVLAYGDEYPAEVAPTGMTTWWILGRCIAGLRVGPGQRLVDLACGSGGPGLWLARASGADLVGGAWSPVAVQRSGRRRGLPRRRGLRARSRCGASRGASAHPTRRTVRLFRNGGRLAARSLMGDGLAAPPRSSRPAN